MLTHPQPDPVAFEVFGWPVRWYGMMYLFGFLAAWLLGRVVAKRPAFRGAPPGVLEDMISASVMGVVVGGRLGYVLFYNPAHYFANPADIPRLWDGGMSFHGGLLGVVFALWLLAKIRRLPFLRLTDYAAVLAPPGLFFGRMGNFVNGELPGRLASPDLPWAMVFPQISNAPRHPSQLYEAALEGVVLGILVWSFTRRRRAAGFISGIFLTGYAAARLTAEFFREPDLHLGFLWLGLSMGQWLSLPMLLLGIIFVAVFYVDDKKAWGADSRELRIIFVWNALETLAARVGKQFGALAAKFRRAEAGGKVAVSEGGVSGGGGAVAAMKSWAFSPSGSDEEDEDEYEDERLTRRDKRRLRKKKRR